MASEMAFTSLFALLLYSATAFPTTLQGKRQSQARSPNYSGAALTSVPNGSAFNYMTAQINIADTIYVQAEAGVLQKAAAWVGFGGISGQGGIIQTGCAIYNKGDGSGTSARCWYEFYPDPPVFYDDFYPSPSDTILFQIYRNSDTSGSSCITNLSTDEAVNADFDAPDGHSCAGTDAEWVIKNPAAAKNFVNFQKQFFEGCNTQTEAGNTYGPRDATYRLINEWRDLGDGHGKTQWTRSSLPSDSEVEVD